SLLLCGMDRGLRVYGWEEVAAATSKLPAPKLAFDSELVQIGISKMRMIYAVEYDPVRQGILWSGLEGKLYWLESEKTHEPRTLLTLPKGYFIRQMQLIEDDGPVLACEVLKRGRSTWPSQGLFLLDLPKLLAKPKTNP